MAVQIAGSRIQADWLAPLVVDQLLAQNCSFAPVMNAVAELSMLAMEMSFVLSCQRAQS